MGVLTDLIIADHDEAQAILESDNHLAEWHCLEFKGIEQVKLTALWGLLTGKKKFDVHFCKNEIKLVMQVSEHGSWLYQLPPRFIDKLLAVPPQDRAKLAKAWAKDETFDGWRPEDVQEYLEGFIDLAEASREEGCEVLLWICV